MKPTILTLALCAVLAAPAAAQSDDGDDGASAMQRGLELFMEGLRDELAPALRQFEGLAEQFEPKMREWVEEMGPAIADLMARIDDLSVYEAPEILPNGDIIIRRKPDAPPYDPDAGKEPDEPVDI